MDKLGIHEDSLIDMTTRTMYKVNKNVIFKDNIIKIILKKSSSSNDKFKLIYQI